MKTVLLSAFLLIGGLITGFGQKVTKGEHDAQIERLRQLNPGFEHWKGNHITEKWRQIEAMPKFEDAINRNSTSWQTIGPSGHLSSEGYDFYCSGRVRDVEVLNDKLIRVATASGGLWQITTDQSGTHNFKNLSDHEVLSSWSGCVATDPSNSDIILYGTGEPGSKSGSGLWRTTDGGATWTQNALGTTTQMDAFDEIEFTSAPGVVWCTGSNGVFLSANSGATWIKKRTGNHPGMAIYPDQPNKILVSEYGKGIYRTKDGGNIWSLLSNGLPSAGFHRIELSNCRTQPNVIYALFTKQDQTTLGIYKTTDGGDNWTRCTVINADGVADLDFHWGMANYCSFISVSPVNPDHVLAGGGWYIYSSDGQNFYGPTVGQHADFHCGGWNADGTMAYYGNDGGIFRTKFDFKWIWDHKINRLPITQFGTLAVSRTNPKAILGGTQDNGLVYYNPTGKNWFYFLGDGGGVAYDPYDENVMYATLGLLGGPHTFGNYRKLGPSAAGWQLTPTGLNPSGQWWRIVVTDYNNPPVLYTQTDNKVYYSENQGDTWTRFVTNDNPIEFIQSMKVSQGEFPKIYASGYGPENSTCMMLDAAIWEWTNITAGLPSKTTGGVYSIPSVYVSHNPAFTDRVYAVMKGYGPQISGKIIYRSDNNGQEWHNITGNLPDVPVTCLLEHPQNDQILVAGTDGFGMFITNDGGINWFTWNDNWPKGSLIAELDYQMIGNDSTYIVAATYGHSILRRELPKNLLLPVNDVTRDKFINGIVNAYFTSSGLNVFTKSLEGQYLLKICNIEGRCVYQKTVNCNENENLIIELPDMPSAQYIVSLQKNNVLAGTIRIFKIQ